MQNTREVYNIFKQHKDVFPHVRLDFIRRKINTDRCVYESGVVINYTIYKRRQKVGLILVAKKGDVMLNQIANTKPGNGRSEEVLRRFFVMTKGRVVWLTVRADNKRAIRFYEKMGFELMGDISWKSGEIKGCIFRRL